ncbi:MAG: hypothetical protein QOJ29_4035 [Thermoleophilaceae bacterium]|nr:hypothetical protein [Thermoleophilaceae bacterium]
MLAIALVAAASVALFALPLAFAVQRSYRDEELLRLQRDTVAATRAVDIANSTADPLELPASRDRLAVYDPGGRRVAGQGPPQADKAVREALQGRRPADQGRDNSLVAAVPLLANERVVGALRGERGNAAVTRASRRAWLALAGVALAVVALATLAATLLARRLASPLERIAGAARRLGSGDFTITAPVTGLPEADEVGRALDATASRLEDLVNRERAFSADASHQLRTPLAALRIELDAMELDGKHSPEIARALAQLDRVESTIETLLSLARDAPRGAAQVDVIALVDDAATRWRGVFATAGRPLRTAVPRGVRWAQASPEVSREIVDVLLDNALKHGAGEVDIAARERDGWFVVEVRDRGPGFEGDPEEAFARRSPAAVGHGIGLALARSLAHAEGGRLSVASAGPEPVLALVLPAAPDPA